MRGGMYRGQPFKVTLRNATNRKRSWASVILRLALAEGSMSDIGIYRQLGGKGLHPVHVVEVCRLKIPTPLLLSAVV